MFRRIPPKIRFFVCLTRTRTKTRFDSTREIFFDSMFCPKQTINAMYSTLFCFFLPLLTLFHLFIFSVVVPHPLILRLLDCTFCPIQYNTIRTYRYTYCFLFLLYIIITVSIQNFIPFHHFLQSNQLRQRKKNNYHYGTN